MVLFTIEETCPAFELQYRQRKRFFRTVLQHKTTTQRCKLVLSFQVYGKHDVYLFFDNKSVSLYSSSEGRPIFALCSVCLGHNTVVILYRMQIVASFNNDICYHILTQSIYVFCMFLKIHINYAPYNVNHFESVADTQYFCEEGNEHINIFQTNFRLLRAKQNILFIITEMGILFYYRFQPQQKYHSIHRRYLTPQNLIP